MPQCGDNSEMLFRKLDSHTFLAKLSNAVTKTCSANGHLMAAFYNTECPCFFGTAFLINIVVLHGCQYDFQLRAPALRKK